MTAIMVACSKDKDDDQQTETSLKTSLVLINPSMQINLLALSSEGRDVDTQFKSYTSQSNPSFTVWAKQNGTLFYFDDIEGALMSGSNTKTTLNLDLSKKISPTKPYDIYVFSCGWHRVENELFFKNNLTRGGGFWTYAKVSNPDASTEVTKRIAGTCEVLFIINKSGKPIKFKHKGFEAEKKWYYTKAEASVDDGHVIEAEQGDEVFSDEYEVSVFENNIAYKLNSYYIPNGQKIHNARLIAEIDGKEVRSENMISSDITLQLNHCYGMFAIWDGEKLMLGDENGEPVIIDLSDSEQSGVDVISISNDGTLTIETTEEKVPQVGDILCSGPTEFAPYGYLFKVTKVNSLDGPALTRGDSGDKSKFIIEVISSAITSAIKNFHGNFRFPINLNDVKINNVMTEEGVNLTSSGDYQTIWQLPKKKITYGNISFTPNVKIKPKSLVIYLEVGEMEIKKFGADFDADFEASVQIDANFKGTAVDKTYPIYDVFLEPITIMIGYVPVVLTPYFMVYLTIKVDGSAQLSWVPVSCAYDVHLGGFYNTELEKFVPSEGKKDFLTYENCKQTQDTWLDLNSGFTFEGTVKSGLGVGLSLGLYGCNLIGKGNVPIKTNGYMVNMETLTDLASMEVYADIYDKMTAGISLDNIDLKPGEENHFDDICKTSIEFLCGVSMHLGFNHPITGERKGFDPKFETDPLVILKEKDGQTLFWPGFLRLKASLSGNNLHMTSDKLRPIFNIFEEKGFGYRYVKIKDGQISGQWDMFDVSSSYSHDVYKSLWEYTVEADIPINKFEWGNTYFICPYTCFKWYNSSAQYYISRQGMYITINNNGKLVENVLGEVPGEDL